MAVVESAARGLVPKALEEFWKRHPQISVDVHVAGSQRACDAVAEGECDLALAFDVRLPRNVRKISTADLPLGVVAHPDHRLAGRKEMKLFDLAGEQVIVSDNSLALGISIDDAIGRSMIELTRRSRTNSIALMTEMARLNLGVVLRTKLGIESEVADGALVFVPLRDARMNPHRLMLLARPEREMSDAASAFAALLARRLEALGE